MADIAASDVSYTQLSKEIGDSGYRKFRFSVVFGSGALTYPAGGIPLTAAKLGCPSQIRSLNVFSPSSGDGYSYKYDHVNNKIRVYQAPAHPFTITKGAILSSSELGLSADATTATVNNNTIAASRTLGTANSPVVAAANQEIANAVTLAATTLYIEVSGW